MTKSSSLCGFLVVILSVLAWALGFQKCHGRTFSFDMHHGLSERVVRKWRSQMYAKGIHVDNWPVKGSIDYYVVLADRDRILRGRQLFDVDLPMTFADGNSTLRSSSMGFLHYATVSLGTPGIKFLVALDTGSDLFWVPCDCIRCAPTLPTAYGPDYELSIYNPKGSSTSKKVSCNNSLCANLNQCPRTFSNCPYLISYISADTSTSGVLMEDILHLIADEIDSEVIDARITFGCGQVQTGSFLDFAAPNGLFGLGMEKISVPSMLYQLGLTADSFSMCFGSDGYGRISFGDKGTSNQEETPLNINTLHPTYNISVTGIRVGTSLIDTNLNALFDSGTSFTYLVDPVYKQLSKSFNRQARDSRRPPDSRIPFEYCYDMSSDTNSSLIPSMSLTMKGGSQFAVYDPIIVISTQAELVYCLAVVRSADLNIIGQNFMTGHKIVFNREKLTLGWKKFNCYSGEDSSTLPSNVQNSTNIPPAVGQEDAWNKSQIFVEPPPEASDSFHWNFNPLVTLCILLLLLIVKLGR